MMSDIFWETIAQHLVADLPFVVYRKSGGNTIKALLQNTSDVYEVTDFVESGFVFAPFTDADQTVLIPLSKARYLEAGEDFEVSPGGVTLIERFDEVARNTHVALVAKGVEALQQEADFKKVVLSRREEIPFESFDKLQVFMQLLKAYPNANCYLWYHPEVGCWMGATPETLLSLYRNQCKTMALAGTQKFNGTTEVNWGGKEKEEQQIVTDTIVNALKGKGLAVSVSEPYTYKAGTLLHLRTDITAVISNDTTGVKDLVQALHPTPAVCGLPLVKARDFIINNENYRRTYYTGYLGELNMPAEKGRNRNPRNVENSVYRATGTITNLYVNLRCMEITDTSVSLYVGGGITALSNPEAEWEETVHKTATMKKVL